MKKIVSVLMVFAILCCLCACGTKPTDADSQSEPASSAATNPVQDTASLTEMPEDADLKLSDDQLRAVAAAYADYMTAALKNDGYTVTARFESDGSIHFDGERVDANGNVDTIIDLNKFEDATACFAYLYNCGQVDIDGNLLVGVSEGVQEAVEETAAEAESEAEEILEEAEAEAGAEGDVALETEDTPAEG